MGIELDENRIEGSGPSRVAHLDGQIFRIEASQPVGVAKLTRGFATGSVTDRQRDLKDVALFYPGAHNSSDAGMSGSANGCVLCFL